MGAFVRYRPRKMAAWSAWRNRTVANLSEKIGVVRLSFFPLRQVSVRLGTLLILMAMSPSLVVAQGARRPIPVGVPRDTMSRAPNPDSATATLRLFLKPPAQDSTRKCQSSTPYMLMGGLVGAVIGSARYEKHEKSTYSDFDTPWLSMPLIVGPWILGGMFLGYLFAPC